ncbi:MAG: toprim domain-containing protein [Patescibacteria group bacterium]
MALPRIAPDELERLKAEIPIQRLAEARGIKLKPQGKDLVGLCPFHEDHNPSLIITPSINIWHCMGECNMGGSVIDWVMKAEGVSFRHAVEILREGVVPQGSFSEKLTKKATVPKLPPPVDFSADEQQLFHQVIDYYHRTLKQTPEGLAYLESRGLKNSQMIDHFRIGYSNRTLGLRLPDKNRQAGAAIREKLSKMGLMRESGHEFFRGSVVFPIFDEYNNVTEIYGRKTCTNRDPRLQYHSYLPGPHKGIFNIQGFQSAKEIILCEAIIDALTFWCAGFRNVTASYGVNGFTPDHLDAFKKYGIERVYIAYDRDKAGEKAAKELSEKLVPEGFEVFQILFPRDMDANEYAQKVTPAEKSLDLAIRNAVWIGKGNRKMVQVSGTPEAGCRPEEPKAATKWGNLSEEIPGPETLSQASSREEKPSAEPRRQEALSQPTQEQEEIFPLDAKKTIVEPPTPEPARTAPVTRPTVPEPVIEIKAEEIIITIESRRWRVRGLSKNMSYESIKVNLMVSKGDSYYVDTIDLYSARSRLSFVKQAAEDLRVKEDVIKSDLGKVLQKLEEIQEKQIKEALAPKDTAVVLSDQERAEALELLQDPHLLTRILSDFEKCGSVGEETNKLVCYLSAVSRKLENPLAVIIQSSSAAGKTSLMEAVLAFLPEEERVKYSAMTGQSLFYMGETSLKNKILAIVEEEGAERASYAIKLLQSEGELTIASTGKDPSTGKLVTHEYHVEGPVMIFVTTTKIDIDLELQNRCIVITVNEGREQTRAIHKLQREMETLEGLTRLRGRSPLYKLHRNAQRLIRPLLVANPYARELTFLDDTTRTRRDHKKYLTLIRAITLLRQYQRPMKNTTVNGYSESFIEVTFDDIELANKLANEVLGRTLDELLPQTRKFIDILNQMVKTRCEEMGIEQEDFRFHRREICDFSGWCLSQVRVHLERLVDMEYVLVHRGLRGQCFVYELLYNGEGKDGKPFVLGLINLEKLKEKTNSCNYVPKVADFSPGVAESNEELSGPKRPQNGGETGGWRTPESTLLPVAGAGLPGDDSKNAENSRIRQGIQHAPTNSQHNPKFKPVKDKGNGSESLFHEVS